MEMDPENAASNPVDVDMFNNLHTDTEVQTTAAHAPTAQAAFVQKCLHPPSAIANFSGIPTNDTRTQVCAEWRSMEIMNAPRILDYTNNTVRAATPADLSTFNMAFLSTNGMRVQSIAFVSNSTNSNRMDQDFANTMIQGNYDTYNLRFDAQLYRPTFKSSTFYLNATAFNDTGTVVCNQFNPNIMFSGTLLSMADHEPHLFREHIKYHFKRSGRDLISTRSDDDHEQHRSNWTMFPAHVRVDAVTRLGLKHDDIIKLDPNTSIQVISLGQTGSDTSGLLVPTTSQILQQSTRSLGTKAKEGVFSVQRLNTITPAWLSAGNTSRASITPLATDGLYQCYYYDLSTPTIGGYYAALLDNAPAGTSSALIPILYDTLWTKDMTFSWIRFDGLSLNNTNSAPQSQLLIKKVYVGYEIQPSFASPWSGMVHLSPKPDLAAMQALMDGFYELKDAFPARYNFWGVLGQLAASGLKTFGSSVLKGLTSPDKKEKKEKTDRVEKKVERKEKNTNNRVQELEEMVKELRLELRSRAKNNQQPKPTKAHSAKQRSTSAPPVPKARKPRERKQRERK